MVVSADEDRSNNGGDIVGSTDDFSVIVVAIPRGGSARGLFSRLKRWLKCGLECWLNRWLDCGLDCWLDCGLDPEE